MIIELYNGHKLFIKLVQYYDIVQLGGLGPAKKGYVAIPGGGNRDEKTVRKWAKEFGFRVKTIREPEIDDETAVPVP